MTPALPPKLSLDEYETFRLDTSRWSGVAADIARAHGLPSSDLHVFTNGTNLVVGLDERLILKIFPPMLRHQFVAECASLGQLEGRLSVPTPERVVQGERDGWPYLVMTRLRGHGGDAVWSSLLEEEKEAVLAQLGALIAEVQRVPPGPLLGLEPRWAPFLEGQLEGCRSRHQRLGLPARLVDEIDDYLHEAVTLIPRDAAPVILTGEFIPQNLLLEQSSAGWRLVGLFDFGDVMTGWCEYDLLGPSVFMGGGRPGRIRSLLSGFGYMEPERDASLTRRLLALLLLHRFSDLPRQVAIEDWQSRAGSLLALERLIWPVQVSGPQRRPGAT